MSKAQESFHCWLGLLRLSAAQAGWRYLLVLSGDEGWGLGLCASAGVLLNSQTLWLSERAPVDCRTLAPGKANSLLGSETGNIVFDAWSGFHPNAFAALAGTVRAGGLLVLLVPPLEQWPDYDDPDYRRMAVSGYPQRAPRRFLAHLARVLRSDQSLLCLRQGEDFPAMPEARPADLRWGERDDTCLTADQWQAVAAIEQVARGHRNRPLVLCADRGRGKTAALGIAAARLLQDRVEPIIVTAPLLRNVEPLFERAIELLPGAQYGGGSLSWQGARITFMPPDRLLESTPEARLVLVDEAAAIPAHLLSGLLDRYRRLVFTTTVHGYEGTGRGFAIRFQGELSRRMPQWRHQTMAEPVRWAAGDPLERSLAHLLLLQAEAAADAEVVAEAASAAPLRMTLLDRRRLLDEPALLQSLFGLLVMAHYRTTPDDLRLLLDGPNLRVGLLQRGDAVVGGVLIACEGPLDPELAAQVRLGRRRPRGHLLPQTLLAQTGNASLLGKTGWRVVRIAIHPVLQRKGLGLRLLDWLAAEAAAQGVDYLGSSFGATAGLVEFWQRAGYGAVSLGSRRDGSSGGHALLVLKPLSADIVATFESERRRFAEWLSLSLADALRDLEWDVTVALLRAMPSVIRPQQRDRDDVQAFADGARSYHACLLGLWRLALERLAHPTSAGGLTPQQMMLLVHKVLQHRSWAQSARAVGLTGRAQVLEALRGAFREDAPPS